MPSVERCFELIHQADGSLDEKLECAQMGYHGNIPSMPIYGYGATETLYVIPADEWPEIRNRENAGEMGSCCKCQQRAAAGSASLPGNALPTAGAHYNVSAGVDGIGGFNIGANGTWLLLIIAVAVVIARRS